MLACAIGAPQAAMLAVDLAVFDGGGARQFLVCRGHLLRPDERELLGQWLTEPMDLYEVTRVSHGSKLWLRSLVGGLQDVEQRDRMFSLSVQRLDLVVGRLLPDGTWLPDGTRRLRALGGMVLPGRHHRRQVCAMFRYGPVPPGSIKSFPEQLLSLFAQQPPRRFLNADGDEYRSARPGSR
jgi:hypothetical protein